ncbi:hypothetical protein Nitsa_1820 [Nitratifractor salsuginis DSM 16511]|uniref:Phospholipase D-like domain-containing protein n=2 Tax=Nitratifractor salsuginis TaxID=269261 RepID=E6X1S4_NITSE|nr:hypothetical protein Nitsa_1820 [Nitratifractor salsuginis DSM 16511]
MGMKPKTHRKKSKREIRMERTASASVAIGEIEHGQDVFILTYGQFSLIDALIAILRQTGPADVIMSTWTAAAAHLDKTAAMMEDKNIRSLKMIVDRSFRTRQPKYFARMIELFGEECFREITTHAKFLVVKNDEWNIVVRTSMNLNENPRLENLEISDDKNFADFFIKIADSIFKEVPAGKGRGEIPELRGLSNTTRFKKIEAGVISPTSLKEASYDTEMDTKSAKCM